MTETIETLLEPIQNRLNAATPGPWEAYDANEGEWPPRPMWCVANEAFHNPSDDDEPWLAVEVHTGCQEDADFIAAAPTDQARLIAAVRAVAGLHKPVTLWMAHEDSDVSYQSKEDLLAERADLTEEDLVPFELCGHCQMIEDSPCEGECTMQAGYRESLWPCPTVTAIESALTEAR